MYDIAVPITPTETEDAKPTDTRQTPVVIASYAANNTYNANPKPAASLLVINKPAPDFNINNADGTAVSFTAYKGKKVLLIFWSSLNEGSIAEYKKIAANLPMLTAKGYSIIAVGLEFSRYQWTSAITDNNLPGTQLCEFGGSDTETTQKYGVSQAPALFVINTLGRIAAQAAIFNELEAQIK